MRAELGRQLRRRRTRIVLALLTALPVILAVAYRLGSSSSPTTGAVGLPDLAGHGAANFTLFAIFVANGFLLVVVASLFAGDTLAAEASWSSLRYLLTLPVPRGRLLAIKFAIALALTAASILLYTVVAAVCGVIVFGTSALSSPLGATLSNPVAAQRIAIVLGYVLATLIMVCALAFTLGATSDQPLAAVGGAVAIVVVSDILDQVTALGSWRVLLPTHDQYAWTDTLGGTIDWTAMSRGLITAGVYSLLLLTLAWWRFGRADVLS